MNKKRFIPFIVVIVLVVIVTLYFEVFRYIGVDKNKIEGSGTIEVTEIEISSKIAGRVASLPKPEGSHIEKGELVVKLEYDELSAQKYSAEANLTNAERNLKRAKELLNTGSISKRDYDNAETVYRVARAAFDQVGAVIENAVIYSPVSGVVLDSNLEIGEMAFPGTPILTVADIKKTWMYIYVNEINLGKVKIGQKARVYVDSFPDKAFDGNVASISNKAEFTPKTIQTKEERVKLMFAVKVVIDNPKEALKPGMPADAEIITNGDKS